jgi:hypothetical protein
MAKEGLPLPIYKQKNDFAGLQAADQYAWEQTFALKEHKKGLYRTKEPRDLFGWLLQGIPKLHVHAPLSFLVKLCEEKGIPIRNRGMM